MKIPISNIVAEQKGFTLVELLVAMGILGAIMATLSMSVITVRSVSPWSQDWSVALERTQNAGYWISRDVQMARDITVDTDPATELFLTLTIPEWDGVAVVDRTVTYLLRDMSGGMKKLLRSYQSGQPILISDYIYYNPADLNHSTWVLNYQTADEDLPYYRVLTFRIAVKIDATTLYEKVVEYTKEYEAQQRVPPLY